MLISHLLCPVIMPARHERYNAHRLPGRRLPTERITVVTKPTEVPAVTFPGWAATVKMIELRIKDPQYRKLRRLFNDHRPIIKDAYEAWFQKATARPEDITPENDRMAKFNEKYLDNPSSPDHNPDLITALGPLISMTRDGFPNFAPKKK